MAAHGDFQGRTLAGRFELVRLLGVGAFSRVFEAIDTARNERVAVKVLLPLWASRERVRARFVREAELLVHVRSSCAVRIHGLGHDLTEGPFLVMELLEGPLLSQFVSRISDGNGRLPVRMAARVCSQVAEAIAAVHARGIVHRDLKPENVIVVSQDPQRLAIKLIDFGLAERAGEAVPEGREARLSAGTPRYMSPEQALGRDPCPESDLYSLGVILYELLTGRCPFETMTFLDLQVAQTFETPLAPSRAAPDARIPRALDALTLALLRRDPRSRPHSAAVVSRVLREQATERKGWGRNLLDALLGRG